MNPSIFNFNEHGVRVALDVNGQQLLQMMSNRQQVGLSNDGVLIDSNININRVQ